MKSSRTGSELREADDTSSSGAKSSKAGDRTLQTENVSVLTRKLRKEFDGLVAVNDLNLRIQKGIIYGMIGPNGSGKTTTIKMLAGLLRPTSGDAFVLEEKVPAKKCALKVGYMPQEMAIYPDLTVHENLELFASLYSVRNADFEKREREILDIIDMKDRRDTLASNLSGGMKHRVSLACSLVHEPELVFLDEPTVGVDPELRVGFWEYFATLKRKGTTVVLTTHYMDEAVRCDIVSMMRSGRLIAEGTPQKLMEATGTKDLESAFLAYAKEVDK